jgi:hypothetical protein
MYGVCNAMDDADIAVAGLIGIVTGDKMSDNPLPALKPETVEAIKNDPFAMATLNATRQFLMTAHRDWSRLTVDGKMIFEHDEAGIAWCALGLLMDADPDDNGIPSDTTVAIGGVCMNIESINMLQKSLANSHKLAAQRKANELANA